MSCCTKRSIVPRRCTSSRAWACQTRPRSITRSGSMRRNASSRSAQSRLQEGQGTFPDQVRCLGVVLRPVGLDEPVAGAGIDVEGHLASRRADLLLQRANSLQRLEVITLCEVTEVGGPRRAVIAVVRP